MAFRSRTRVCGRCSFRTRNWSMTSAAFAGRSRSWWRPCFRAAGRARFVACAASWRLPSKRTSLRSTRWTDRNSRPSVTGAGWSQPAGAITAHRCRPVPPTSAESMPVRVTVRASRVCGVNSLPLNRTGTTAGGPTRADTRPTVPSVPPVPSEPLGSTDNGRIEGERKGGGPARNANAMGCEVEGCGRPAAGASGGRYVCDVHAVLPRVSFHPALPAPRGRPREAGGPAAENGVGGVPEGRLRCPVRLNEARPGIRGGGPPTSLPTCSSTGGLPSLTVRRGRRATDVTCAATSARATCTPQWTGGRTARNAGRLRGDPGRSGRRSDDRPRPPRGRGPRSGLPALVGALARPKPSRWPGSRHHRRTTAERTHRTATSQRGGARLGVSPSYIYKNARTLPFTARIGRRVVALRGKWRRWSRQRRAAGKHA